jgi:hypothetical protein
LIKLEHLTECRICSFVIADNRLTENSVQITGYWPSRSRHSQYSNSISAVKLRASRWARST